MTRSVKEKDPWLVCEKAGWQAERAKKHHLAIAFGATQE